MRRELTVEPESEGKRLDVFLKKHLPDESRAFLQYLIRDGTVTVNGKKNKSHYLLRSSDHIVVDAPIKQHALAPEPDLPIPIIYESAELLVINKPSGIAVHPVHFPGSATIVNWLVARYPKIRSVGDSRIRPGIAHRLDKGTSGVMAIAKTQKMFEHLKQLFKTRVVKKEYLAILEGKLAQTEGVVEGYLAPSKKDYRKKKFQKLPTSVKAKMSRTQFRVMRYVNGLTLAKFFPETGRTHQIRVHAKSLGTPVLGDMLYGAKLKLPDEFHGRFFLHASQLSFPLPNGVQKSFFAPLPEDFRKVIQRFSAHKG